jgi:hypothetical protein
VIGGVLDYLPNAVSTAWCRLLAAADRCRIERHQFVIAPERTNDLCWLVDLNPEHLPFWPGIDNVGNGYDHPSAIERLAGIELLDELLARVEFFCY